MALGANLILPPDTDSADGTQTGNVILLSKTDIMIVGKLYRVYYDLTSVAGFIRARCGFSGEGGLNAGDGSFTEDIICAGNGSFNFLADLNFNGTVSNVSVREVLPTTTTRTTWTDSTTTGVIGHKIYRDDVEIADVGMGVETYDDTTALMDTIYKYEVQAYSADDKSDTESVGNVKTIKTLSNDVSPQNHAAAKWAEADATTNWENVARQTQESSSADVQHGSYAMKFTGNSASGDTRSVLTIPTVSGNTYRVNWWHKEATVSALPNPRITVDGVITNVAGDTTWTSNTQDVVASGTSFEIRAIAQAGSNDSVGDVLWVDGLEVLDLGVI